MATFILLAQTSTSNAEGSSNGGLIFLGVIALVVYIAAMLRSFIRFQNDEEFDGLDKIIVVLAIPAIIFVMFSGMGYIFNKKSQEE